MKTEKKTLIIYGITLAIGIILVAGSYICKFSDSSISSNPSDWGVLGDYVGGTLNPLISLITLFYLIRTYLSQKEELLESGRAAKNTAKIQLYNTLVLASYEKITLYRNEMEGVTRTIYAPLGNQEFMAIDGKSYKAGLEQRTYRSDLAKKIQAELKKIDEYLLEIESLSN